MDLLFIVLVILLIGIAWTDGYQKGKKEPKPLSKIKAKK